MFCIKVHRTSCKCDRAHYLSLTLLEHLSIFWSENCNFTGLTIWGQIFPLKIQEGIVIKNWNEKNKIERLLRIRWRLHNAQKQKSEHSINSDSVSNIPQVYTNSYQSRLFRTASLVTLRFLWIIPDLDKPSVWDTKIERTVQTWIYMEPVISSK